MTHNKWIHARRSYIAAYAFINVIAAAWLTIRKSSHLVDELPHHNQIKLFLDGRAALEPRIGMLPGFHAILALIARITGYGYDNLNALRLYVACFSLVLIYLFFRSAKEQDPDSAQVKLTQFVFLPILFPYFVLLYTDVMSLLFVILTLTCILQRRYIPGILAGVISICIRQNNVIWFGFFFLLFLQQEYGAMIRLAWNSSLHQPARWGSSIRKPGFRILTAGLLFIAVFAAFAAFLRFNGGPATGDREANPFPSFHAGNIVFGLILFAVLFLPLHLKNIPRIVLLWQRQWKWLVPLVVGLFTAYMFLFVNDHPYNQDLHFLRNRVLIYATTTPLHKALFFVPVLWSLLSLLVTRLRRPIQYWIYPFSIVFLMTLWMIEQRYVLIPLVFWILFRTEEELSFEWTMAGYGIVGTITLFIAVARKMTFL